jgi:hypothetical protein
LPWKWSYRSGTMILRDHTATPSSSTMNVHVSAKMMQYLMVGMPPLTLVYNSKESQNYFLSTNISSFHVAKTILDGLMSPGYCSVNVTVKCSSTLDSNNELYYNGRDYQLISFDLLQ